MTFSLQEPPAPATSNSCGDSKLDQAIQSFVDAFRKLDPSGRDLQDGAADTLMELWLQRGRDLPKLRQRLKQAELPGKWAEAWARDIDYLFAGRAGRGVARDRMQQEIALLVRQLNAKTNDPGIYQQLVALGSQEHLDVKWFQRCLQREKLEKSRISEIIRIIKSKETAKQFIAGTLSVRRALFLARNTPDTKQENTVPAGGAEVAEDKAGKADKKAAENPRDKRLAVVVQALLILVKEELTRKVRGRQLQEWRLDVGLYHLSFKPETRKRTPKPR